MKPAHQPIGNLSGPCRLQRVLAAAGLGSRRKCEEYIRQGRVTVDGDVVEVLGTKVDPTTQAIEVDGEPIKVKRRIYFMLNKPPGVLSTSRDESGRMRAIDLIATDERIFTIGRLDKSSEGLILLTNDGELAQRLTHPRHGVPKTYLVRVVGEPSPDQLNQLLSGVRLAEGIARAAEIRIRKSRSSFSELEIVLTEGRNREIRRLLAAIGHKVVMLRRIAVGRLRLGELPVGAHRALSKDEIDMLYELQLPARPPVQHVRGAVRHGDRPKPAKSSRRFESRSRPSTGRDRRDSRPGQNSSRRRGGRPGRRVV